MRGLAAALLLLAACGGCRDKAPAPPDDAARVRRVVAEPPGHVRAVPPFAIRSDGVGPFLLGTQLLDVLELMPRGPHVEALQLEGVIAYSVARAEEGLLVIGVESEGGVAFTSVLDKEIARTANGVGVGSTDEELRAALGAPQVRPNMVRDARIREFASLPNVRFVVDGGKVTAVVVSRAKGEQGAAGDEPAPQPAGGCRGGALAEPAARAALLEAARLDAPADQVKVEVGCFSGPTPEALVTGGDKLAIVGGDAAKLRRLAVHPLRAASYAGPLDLDADGRDEIAVVTEVVTSDERSVELEVLRWDAGKLAVAVAAEPVYRVSSVAATWIGADLRRIDLLLEVSVRGSTLLTGGLYVHHPAATATGDAAPMIERAVEVKRRRPGGPAVEGAPEGTPAADAGPGAGTTPEAPAGQPPHRDGGTAEPAPATEPTP